MTVRTLRAAVALATVAATLALPATAAHADEISDAQWHLRAMNVAAAHKISKGAGVTVAVIDSGVEPHPDLRKNLLSGTDVVPGGSGDGREDAASHGTAMAGLIAAHGKGGGNGALGIAPKAKILPIRDETPKKVGSSVEIARAIRYAISRHADIINISSAATSHPDLANALKEAAAADIVVVAAAGNRPDDVVVPHPAFYDGVVAVGATDRRGNHADVSVTDDKVEIAAPGVDIASTHLGGIYQRATGTSSSTALVAGAAALVRSKYPDLSAKEVVHRLTATATDKGPAGRDPEYGFGVVNLVKALTANVPPATPTASPPADPGGTRAAPSADAVALPADGGSGPGALLALLGIGLFLVVVAAVAAVLVTRSRRRHPAR